MSLGYQPIGFLDGMQKGNNLISYLQICVERYPEKVALKWVPRDTLGSWDGARRLEHNFITYGELSEKVAHLARGLRDIGIGWGDRVIIFLPPSLELYLTMFGIIRIGATAVFIDPWATKEQVDLSIITSKPKAMMSGLEALQTLSVLPSIDAIPLKILSGSKVQDDAIALTSLFAHEEAAIEAVEGNMAALITFTTGSSGVSKGVLRTHRHLSAQHKALTKAIPYNEGDVDLPTFPIFSLNSLASGITTILPAINPIAPSERDASIIANQITSCGVTTCTFSPSLLLLLADYCQKNGVILPTLARVVTGGAPVSKNMVQKFKAVAPGTSLMVLYGSTEVEPVAQIEDYELLTDESGKAGLLVGHIDEDLESKFIMIHKGTVELSVKGWSEWEVPEGDIGELILSGSHVCDGYYNNPEAFKASKIKEPNGKVWHRTGDIGFLDNEKRLWLVGRVHNIINRNHARFFSYYPELLLGGLEFVQRAAFLGLEDDKLGERACAIVLLKDGYDPANKKFYRQEIQHLFKIHNIPVDDIMIVDSIPMDPRHRSKVDYFRLKEALK